MSLPVTMYYCTACDFEQGDGRTWGTREYVLESGVRIPVRWHIGWCESCDGLAAIEDLSSQTRIQEYRGAQLELNRLERPGRFNVLFGLSKHHIAMERMYQEQMDDAIDALEMLTTRKSPPHCLLCLSTKVHVPEKFARDGAGKPEEMIWQHPGCGGQIRTRWPEDGMRVAMRPSVHRYTPEGLFIEKEWVSGYHAPDSSYWEARSIANRNFRALRMDGMEDTCFFGIPNFLRNSAD